MPRLRPWGAAWVISSCSLPMASTAQRVTCRDVTERHARTDRGPGAGILAPHHARRGVADRVEPGDRRPIVPQHACMLVGHETAIRAGITRIDRDGVVRWLRDRRDARIRLDTLVAVVAVVSTVAAMEVQVDA